MWKYSIGFFLLLLAACTFTQNRDMNETAEVAAVTAVSPTMTPAPAPSLTPTSIVLPTAIPTAVPAAATDLALSAQNVYLYPVPAIFSGDRVTFQILPYLPDNITPNMVSVHILVDSIVVSSGNLNARNLDGNTVGLFKWAWDTTNLAGLREVQIILDRDDHIRAGDEDPSNNQVTMMVTVEQDKDRPFLEVGAEWLTAESNCCFIHAISGTAAARDLPELTMMTETAVQEAVSQLNEPLGSKIEVYFIDKVIGHGGYAGSSIVISYLDRDYAGSGLHEVLVHEASHVIDRQFAPNRIIFLTEGLAVWATGGHFKPDDLNQRSAALVATGYYMPLHELIDDFYHAQHEASYSQAAGFVSYLIDTYGWSTFRAFYSDVTADDAPTLTDAVDLNLQTYYGKTLAEMEAQWLAYLGTLPPDRTEVTDLLTTIRYYDVMRSYQIAYDPTAFFLTSWLPAPQDVRENGNSADLTRHPRSEINLALEVMLQAADMAIRTSDYQLANILLDSITRVLDNGGVFVDPMAVNYLNIIRTAQRLGFEVQQVELMGENALVRVTSATKTTLNTLNFTLSRGTWVLTN
jgi:hypothetical protein